MNRRHVIVLGILILFSQNLFSQIKIEPAYIVTNHNDTLFGVGSMSVDQKYCSFRKIGAKDFTLYYPTEIKVFRFIDDKYYVATEVKEPDTKLNWYFLEYLVDGEIDLFAIPASYRYFIKKENADFFELRDNIKHIQEIDGGTYLVQDKRYLGYIRAYMWDAPQLFSEIDKIRKLNERDLVRLSVDYHHAVCNDYECVNYTKKVLNIRTKVELVSGVTRHNRYYSPKIGVLFHQPVFKDKVFMKAGIIYSDQPYWKKRYYDKEEHHFNLKIPFSFEYVWGGKKFKPTVAFGWPTGILGYSRVFPIISLESGFIYSVTKDWEVSVNGSIDGLQNFVMDEHYSMYHNKLGHSLSLGIIYSLGKK